MTQERFDLKVPDVVWRTQVTQKGVNILGIIDYVTKMAIKSSEVGSEVEAAEARLMQRGLERFHQILQAAQEAGL